MYFFRNVSPMTTSHTPKKKPPPVAPKPRVSWANSTSISDTQWQEDPSSFLEVQCFKLAILLVSRAIHIFLRARNVHNWNWRRAWKSLQFQFRTLRACAEKYVWLARLLFYILFQLSSPHFVTGSSRRNGMRTRRMAFESHS